MSAHSARHRALEDVGSKASVLNGLSVVRDSCRKFQKVRYVWELPGAKGAAFQ